MIQIQNVILLAKKCLLANHDSLGMLRVFSEMPLAERHLRFSPLKRSFMAATSHELHKVSVWVERFLRLDWEAMTLMQGTGVLRTITWLMWFRMVHDQLFFPTLPVQRFSWNFKYKHHQHQDINHAKVCHIHLTLITVWMLKRWAGL